MANEITKVTDQNGVDHPFKDVAAFPRSEQAVLGAKQLLQFPYKLETNENGGITYTTQTNGSVNLNGTVTATYSETPLFYRTQSTPSFYLKKGNYTFSVGDKDGNPITGVTCAIGTTYNGSYKALTDASSSVSLVIDENTQCDYKLADGSCLLAPYIKVANGTQLDNVLVYPLITLASDTDRTFAPYAMTNKELTDKVVKSKDKAQVKLADLTWTQTSTGGYVSSAITVGDDVNDIVSVIPYDYGGLLATTVVTPIVYSNNQFKLLANTDTFTQYQYFSYRVWYI